MSNEKLTQPEDLETSHSGLLAFWDRLPMHTHTLVLDWAVIVAIAILMAVIYIPKGIWEEEAINRDESRNRMLIIQSTQEFYHTLTTQYTTDGKFLFKLVSQTHDTLVGDTTFIGEQIVHVDGLPYAVNVPEKMGIEMDTTFSIGRAVRTELLDTTYTAILWDDERAEFDTIFVNGDRGVRTVSSSDAFRSIIDTTYGSHPEVTTDYSWNRYRLEEELLLNPITMDPFQLSLDSTGEVLTISSPEANLYSERRAIFFKLEAKNLGSIRDGEPTWKNN